MDFGRNQASVAIGPQRRSKIFEGDAYNVSKLTAMGKSDDEICTIYSIDGKPRSAAWLIQTRKISRLNAQQKDEIHNNQLAASFAYFVADLPADDRDEVIAGAKVEAVHEAAADMGMALDEAEALINEATAGQAKTMSPEKLSQAVEAAAQKTGMSKAKAKKVAAAAKRVVKPQPQLKHAQKAAAKTGKVADVRVRKLSDVREQLEIMTGPGSAFKAPAKALLAWIDGEIDTKKLHAALAKAGLGKAA